MNATTFVERWNRLGLQRQLLTCFMAHMAKIGLTELRIPLDALDEIQTGESLVMHLDGNELVLKYVPEQVQLLTIQESGTWPQTTTGTDRAPAEAGHLGGIKSDAELAELEKRQAEAARLRKVAQEMRGKTLRNMTRGLTEDQPPITS